MCTLRSAATLTLTLPVRARAGRGKGRQILQFGSFYDYAEHRIQPDFLVEPMDETLCSLVDRQWTSRVLFESDGS